MAREISIVIMLVAMSGLIACTSKNDTSKVVASAYVSDAPQRVAAADWSRAETVTVSLANFHFTPDRLEFQHDKPYRLHLANQSMGPHTFTSAAFFRAIAVQKLEPGPTDASVSSLGRVDLAPGERKDLYFVAVRPGTYDFDCPELLHHTLGMTGEIIIR